jgi:UDP-4-amino-4,6-dideoxy-N-acetyl-beta-L-altrosamine transaminase
MTAKLAIEGGKPVRKEMLPYALHWVGTEELNAVNDVLKNKMITQGPTVEKFEKMFANYVGTKHAIAVSSCTAGLHLSALALLEPGDEVITSPMTFVATANSILYARAKPVFADIDRTINISVGGIREKITPKTRAIMPVHYAGLPCQMDEILEIAEKHDLFVIEDAAHAAGAEYRKKKIGSIGDATCFSFHPAKQMTTGEGGMITTDDDELAEKLNLLRSHGINKDFKQRSLSGSYYYEAQALGFNYRLSDINAAMGIEQLKKLDSFIKRRKMIAEMYRKSFQDLPMELPAEPADVKHAWHLYTVQLELEKLKADRDKIFAALHAENIGVNVLYIPVYRHPYYEKLGYKPLKNSENVYKRIMTLPLFAKMSDSDADDVIEALKKVLPHFVN